MSLSLGTEGRAAIEAFDACDRMLARLAELLARHEHAAARARLDWEGPHREVFDDHFEEIQYRLRIGELFVYHAQALARAAINEAFEELREAKAAASRVEVRW